ncbi:hypothetical protein GCM10027056_04420 [Glaciibacter psychrotolerans]
MLGAELRTGDRRLHRSGRAVETLTTTEHPCGNHRGIGESHLLTDHLDRSQTAGEHEHDGGKDHREFGGNAASLVWLRQAPPAVRLPRSFTPP